MARDVGIVILHWNNEPATRRLLVSLATVTSPPHRVYVVDNASSDGSVERLAPDFPQVTWIRNGANLGFAGGCNVGARRALEDGAAHVLLLNNDCVITDPAFLEKMVVPAERDPRIGMVGCKLLVWPDSGTIWSAGGFVSGWRQYYLGEGEKDRGQYDRAEPRRFLSGAVLLIPRRTVERVGLLPEAYFFGHEDWEYAVRLHEAGLILWYEGSARVHHESSHSHDVKDPFYVYNDLVSRMLFEKRVLPPASYALWRALYRLNLAAIPVLKALFPRRYLPGASSDMLVACMRAALRDVEWIDRTTPALLQRFRARFAGGGGIRVAQVVATSGLTGVESHLLVLFEGLRREGIDSYLVCTEDGPLTESLTARGFEVRLAAPRRRAGVLELPRLARALDGADVVHAHGPRPLWWIAALRATGRVRAMVGTVHQLAASGRAAAWTHAFYSSIERAAIRRCDEVVAVSRLLRERVVEATGLPPGRVHCVPNSAPVLLEPPRPPAPPTDRVVVVARLSPEKNVETALIAWADPRLAARPLVLEIVGDGPSRTALEKLAQGLGDRVRFLGWSRDVPARIAGARALVSLGPTETFGIAALEAMALGVPVIASDAPGHRDVLGDALAEWVVPATDARAVADALERLLALPPPAREELARVLKERAYREFGPERSARLMRSVYERALERPAAAAPANG